ncbi:MAG: hypothetical protein P9X22_01870 [Candidatus Zapsychrus exili]|nr:hypothetical protein [Candidatus Zapsychrus exili]
MLDYINKNKTECWPERCFTLWPTFCLGFSDGFNPCSLANILLFVMILFDFSGSLIKVIISGVCFIVASLVANYLLVIGAFDFFLSSASSLKAISIFYTTIGAIFLILGILNFYDWIRYKNNRDSRKFLLKLPIFLRSQDDLRKKPTSKLRFFIGILFSAIISALFGFIVTIVQSVLAQDYTLFVNLLNQKDSSTSHSLAIFIYGVSFVLPFIFVWLAIIAVFTIKKAKVIFTEQGSLAKIISSAILLSIGIGLIYSFL